MDDTPLQRMIQAVCHLANDCGRLVRRQAITVLEDLAESTAGDVLQRDEVDSVIPCTSKARTMDSCSSCAMSLASRRNRASESDWATALGGNTLIAARCWSDRCRALNTIPMPP